MGYVVRQYGQYTVIAAVGVSIHALLSWGIDSWFNWHYLIGFALPLPVSHTVKFTLDKVWTFKGRGLA